MTVQHVHAKERSEKKRTKQVRKLFLFDTLTFVDIQEIVRTDGAVIEERISKKNSRILPYKRFEGGKCNNEKSDKFQDELFIWSEH